MAQYEFKDLDGDNYAETGLTDTTGDGRADQAIADTDHDGYFESTLIDFDGNGAMEQQRVDSNRDGYDDEIGVDINNDSAPDVVYTDANGDHYIEMNGQPWTSTVSAAYEQPGVNNVTLTSMPEPTPPSSQELQPWESPTTVHFGTPTLIPGVPPSNSGADVWLKPDYANAHDAPWYDPANPDYGNDFSVPPSSRPWGDVDGNGRLDGDDGHG